MIGLKQHHHLKVDEELREDLTIWKEFLKLKESLCRPFIDFSITLLAEDLDFYTDASLSEKRAAFGIVFGDDWAQEEFPEWVLTEKAVNIQTLEMYALMAGIYLFAHKLRGKRVKIYCDNQAVVAMVNNGTSRCRTCMHFIRLITQVTMFHQVRVFVKYVKSEDNTRADALSRSDFQRFWSESPGTVKSGRIQIPPRIWPIQPNWWGIDPLKFK